MSKIGDLMQKIVFSKTNWAMWFLSHMKSGFWEKKGRQKALTTFHETAKKVKAYREFLKEWEVNPEEIETFSDFQKLPLTDKENYIRKFQIDELCLGGRIEEMYTISTSSGSSGIPSFWPRFPRQDQRLPKYWETFYLLNWDIDRKSTLFVVTMALGNWIAGELVSTITKIITLSGKYPMTVATPGSDVKQIITVIKGTASFYDQVIMVAYPSLIKSILETGEKEGIDWKKINLKLWIGGEGYSQSWENYILGKIGGDESLTTLIGVYGTADVGGIGFGSPFCNLILKLVKEDKKLSKSIFGIESTLPSLVQYNPLSYFIEEIKNELVVTYFGGIPLIRYNLYDKGGIISYDKMLEILETHGYNALKLLEKKGYYKEKIWQWPFVYTFGRKENAISIIGANVYSDNIEAALHTKETEEINSFKLSVQTDKQGNTLFYILVELKNGIDISQEVKENLERKYHNIFLKKLLEINLDFKDAYEKSAQITDPIIKVYQFSSGPFTEKLVTKQSYIHKN